MFNPYSHLLQNESDVDYGEFYYGYSVADRHDAYEMVEKNVPSVPKEAEEMANLASNGIALLVEENDNNEEVEEAREHGDFPPERRRDEAVRAGSANQRPQHVADDRRASSQLVRFATRPRPSSVKEARQWLREYKNELGATWRDMAEELGYGKNSNMANAWANGATSGRCYERTMTLYDAVTARPAPRTPSLPLRSSPATFRHPTRAEAPQPARKAVKVDRPRPAEPADRPQPAEPAAKSECSRVVAEVPANDTGLNLVPLVPPQPLTPQFITTLQLNGDYNDPELANRCNITDVAFPPASSQAVVRYATLSNCEDPTDPGAAVIKQYSVDLMSAADIASSVVKQFIAEVHALRLASDIDGVARCVGAFIEENAAGSSWTLSIVMPRYSKLTLGHRVDVWRSTYNNDAWITALTKIALQLIRTLREVQGLPLPVAHRDLHPGNVVFREDPHVDLCHTDGTLRIIPEAILIDFGAAGYDDGDGMSTVIGSRAYAAPELFDLDHRLTVKADVFSFGTLLWFMSTAESDTEVIQPYGAFRGNIHTHRVTAAVNGDYILPGVIDDDNPFKDIIEACWLPVDERPDAVQVATMIRDMIPPGNPTRRYVDIMCIRDYAKMRSDDSNTMYVLNGTRKGTLRQKNRLAEALDAIEEVLEPFDDVQLARMSQLIRSRRFVMGASPLQDYAHPECTKNSTNCVYLWRSEVSGLGYVGMTKRRRIVRDKEHLNRPSTAFDSVLAVDPDNWEVVTLAAYNDHQRMTAEKWTDLAEILCIVIFNTSNFRIPQMGLNNDCGGKFESYV